MEPIVLKLISHVLKQLDEIIEVAPDRAGLPSFSAERGIGEQGRQWKIMEKLGMTRTGEYGGRRNRAVLEDSFEYQYETLRYSCKEN